jgi:hypothetical protein
MTNTLSLAARLRSMDDEALDAVIVRRRVSAHGVKDFFDLAEALLEPDSIQLALTRLDRPTLAAIAALGALADRSVPAEAVAAQLATWGAPTTPTAESVTERLENINALLFFEQSDGNFAIYDAVREQIRCWPELGLPGGVDLASAPSPVALLPVPGTEARFTDRLASEHAFAAVNRVSELIAELNREPAKELQKGGLALPASKRIAAALSVSLAEVPAVVSIAERAGLIAQESSAWLATNESGVWQLAPTQERWRVLAAAWLATLPEDIRTLLAGRAHAVWGDGLREFVEWVYPAGRSWMQSRITEFVRDAEELGLTARDAPSTPGILLLEQGVDEASNAIAALFPPEVERVYLQHDLTIVSPGPLTPAVDGRLRTLADVESRALASTYRVSAASLNRAIGTGETAESLREFLGRISMSGIPQPLDYLIAETAERYGRVRVAEVAETNPAETSGHASYLHSNARSAVHSDDRQLLRTIEVDQLLTSLGLVRTDPNRLVSRYPRDVVFWALSDARYPVAAEDADGAPVSLRRNRVAAPARTEPVDPAIALIKRLRVEGELDESETSDAWMARQLDIAIRGRVPLRVSVAMPDGRIIDYILEPTGVGGGRLRGRDRGADIERTLPLSSIKSIGAIE